MLEIQQLIKKDTQVKKFCLYGFLKNMKFFEPYMVIYLMSKGISLLELGFLITIRELVVNLLEIPSGLIADHFGRKKELYLCFFFYIISFIFFFITNSFATASIAMLFFGCGEAFRSGSHKAMIYSYLDQQGWTSEKTFTYGLTRSVALKGSAVSSILGIFLVLLAPNTGYIFLFSAIPYALDFLLILSYPAYLDVGDKKENSSFKSLLQDFFSQLKGNKALQKLLLQEGFTESSLSYTKDFLQPLLEFVLLSSGVLVLDHVSEEDQLLVLLGIFYAVLNLVSAKASKQSHKLKEITSVSQSLFWIQISLAASAFLLWLCFQQLILVMLLYFLIFALQSIRKPIYLEELDNNIPKENRATVLSIAAQMKSLCLMILAPIFGYIADTFGLSSAILIISSILFVTTFITCQIHKDSRKDRL